MSAFGTKKPGADEALELTFPSGFSRAYKRKKLGEKYASSPIAPVKQDYVGTDHFALEHQRRREEAHNMVRAAVYATQEARRRAFSSHAGYFGLPPVVLSQRRVGSNFGVGGGGGLGYGMDAAHAGLEGGVIASREGRAWVKETMAKRKAQLDAIDSNQLEAPIVRAEEALRTSLDFSEMSKIELLTYLDQMRGQITSMQITFTSETFRKFLTLLVKFAITADRQEMRQIMEKVNDIIGILRSIVANDDGAIREFGADAGQGRIELLRALQSYFIKLQDEYLSPMFAAIDRSTQDKVTLSKSLIKNAKIGEIVNLYAEAARRLGLLPSAARPRAHGGDDDMPGDDDEGGDGDEVTLPSRGTGQYSAAEFSRSAISAELSGGPRAQLPRDVLRQPDARDRFGAQGQAGEARATRRYAGEDMPPGEQLEQDEEGDAEEASIAASAPSFRSSDSSVVRGAMDLLRRVNERDAARAFPERGFQRLAEGAAEGGEPALARAAPEEAGVEGPVEQYFSGWSRKGYEVPDAGRELYDLLVDEFGEAEEPMNAFINSRYLEGAQGAELGRSIINAFNAAAGRRPIASNTPRYIRAKLRQLMEEALAE